MDARAPKIVVVRGGGLGDFIVTLPALGMLRKRWPDAHITLIGRTAWAELGLHRHYLDDMLPIDGSVLAPFYAETPPAQASWQESLFAHADLIVNITPQREDRLTSSLRALTGPSQQIVSIDARLRSEPAARQLCEGLAPVGLPMPEDFWPRLSLREEDHRRAEVLREGLELSFALLHPGSGSPSKNWPAAHWQELLRSLDARLPKTLVLLIGEAEEHAAAAWQNFQLPSTRVVFLREVRLPVLAALLQRASLYLGHDSGVSHLAAATGTSCLVLFGPSDPSVWVPQGPRVSVVRSSDTDMNSLPPEAVFSAVQTHLP